MANPLLESAVEAVELEAFSKDIPSLIPKGTTAYVSGNPEDGNSIAIYMATNSWPSSFEARISMTTEQALQISALLADAANARIIRQNLVVALDAALAEHNARLPGLQEFILPAGTRAAALAHVCRTVARRAERAVVALGGQEPIKDGPRQYLNRLSDLLFVLARVLNRYRSDGTVGDDVYWKSERLGQADAK